MAGRNKSYKRVVSSLDGAITSVVATDIGDAQTRYTYIDLERDGFSTFSLQWIITATTITIEGCNMQSEAGTTVTGTCTSTDGTGATIVCTTINTVDGFVTNDDLIGCQVTITADATTPANVGLVRTIVDYAQATGTVTLDSVFGATTDSVTSFTISDGTGLWGARVSDPTGSQWSDITNALTASATHTTTGAHLQDTPLAVERLRIKRLTTNATNALVLRLTRGA